MKFNQYRTGWQWYARCGSYGQSSGLNLFATKAAAEADARRTIHGRDAIAVRAEYSRRLMKRGTPCQLTAADHKAIALAAQIR